MIIANSALRPSLAIYHLISNARSWNNCEIEIMNKWKLFQDRYPNTNLGRFTQKGWFDDKSVFFISKDGKEQIDVFDGDNFRSTIYFSKEMKKALGLAVGFQLELILNVKPAKKKHTRSYDFTNLEIFVSPSEKFNIKFLDIFKQLKIRHYSGKESRRWLNGPNMNYWPQQLNFAVWCATTGCGISDRLLFHDMMKDGVHDLADDELDLPPQITSFLWFHVYFTVRRILHELVGIQGTVALPDDSAFEQKNNRYDVPSYKRLCNEFGINNNEDFRFKHGSNNGLDDVYIYISHMGYRNAVDKFPGGYNKFSDEGGKASDGNLIQYIEQNSSIADKQYEYLVVDKSYGLTRAGQARLNTSIEAFVYFILGSQVNVRSTIVGDSGSAQEVRR